MVKRKPKVGDNFAENILDNLASNTRNTRYYFSHEDPLITAKRQIGKSTLVKDDIWKGFKRVKIQ